MDISGLNQITQKWLRAMPIVDKTERDAEAVCMLEFVKEKEPKNLLDVGCASTGLSYLQDLRKLLIYYAGVDRVMDDEVKGVVDDYILGNVNEISLPKYEMVTCVSVIEHAGLSYEGNPQDERKKMFQKCLDLAEKYLWISFPVGQGYRYLNDFEIITDNELKVYEKMCEPYKLKERFYFSQGCSYGHNWLEHDMRRLAVRIPFLEYVGNQSLCIMEVEK